MKQKLFGMMAFTALMMWVVSQAVSQPPGGKGGDKGGPPRFELGQVLPPQMLEELNLTAEQTKELDAIKKELKTKLDKLLTDEQKKKIESFRPRGPGGQGGIGDKGGKGSGPGDKGGKGQPPGDKGSKGGDRPDRPPVEKSGEKSSVK